MLSKFKTQTAFKRLLQSTLIQKGLFTQPIRLFSTSPIHRQQSTQVPPIEKNDEQKPPIVENKSQKKKRNGYLVSITSSFVMGFAVFFIGYYMIKRYVYSERKSFVEQLRSLEE